MSFCSYKLTGCSCYNDGVTNVLKPAKLLTRIISVQSSNTSCEFTIRNSIAKNLKLRELSAVSWGMFSTVGDIKSAVGDILVSWGMHSTVEGHHDKCGGYLEYRGDIMSTVGLS